MPARDEDRKSEYGDRGSAAHVYQQESAEPSRPGDDKRQYISHVADKNNQSVRRETLAEKKYLFRGACTVILAAVASGSFFCAWQGFVEDYNNTGRLLGYGNLSMVVIIYILLYLLVGKGLRAFNIGKERTTNIVVSQALTVFIVDIAEIFISMAVQNQWRYVGMLAEVYLLLGAVQGVVLGLLAAPMASAYRKTFPPMDLIEIYGKQNGVYERINRLGDKYNISEAVYASRYDFDEIVEKIKRHEAVLINDLPSQQKNLILKTCFDLDKRVYVVPKISDVIMKASEELNVIDTPIFMCRNQEMNAWQRVVKRGMDLALSVLALVLLSPVMVITAIAIKREDGGSVFFRQDRCTEGNQEFEILKFRSMREDSGDTLSPTSKDDDRVTKVGKVIRAWRIDELPQLINIIKGDMSIVGPRPERVEHVKKYTELIPEFKFRSKMKGGLTGYAQVYGRYNTSALDKLKLDLIYITNYSLLTDIQIIFETVKILMLKESTEGFHSSGMIERELEKVREEFETREK